MTAVPGAPRRLLLSSSPRPGAPGPFATLGLISVGRRLVGTLRVRTWQLWGAETADCRCIIIMIIRMSPPRFQDSRLSYSRDSSGIPTHFVLHCLQIPRRPARARFDRPTQLRTIRGNFIGNLRISLATLQRSMRSQPAAGTLFLVSSLSLERPSGAAPASSPGAFSAPFLRRTLSTRPRKLRSKTKPGLCGRALHRRRNDALLHRGDLPELALERLVGLPGEVGIKLAELGRFRHKALIGALGVVRL